jgi:hypothetical protein
MRLAGTAGIASFVLLVIGNFISPLWDIPATTAPAAEFSRYARETRGELIAGVFTFGLAMMAFLFFAAGLALFLHRLDALLGAVFAMASATLTAVVFVGFVPILVLAYRTPEPAEAHTLVDLSFGVLGFSGFPTALATGAYAALILRSRALPVWTAWLALLAAIAHIAIGATFAFSSGFLSVEGAGIIFIPLALFLWMLGTGIALVRAPDPAAS